MENVTPAKVDFIEDDSTDFEQKEADLETKLDDDDKPDLHSVDSTQQQPDSSEPMVSEDRYKNLQAAFTRTSQENASNKATIAQMQEQLQQLTNAQQQQQNAVQQQQQEPKQTSFDDLDKSASEFEEMKPMVEHIKRLEKTIRDMQGKQAETVKQVQNTQQQSSKTAQQTAQEMHNQRILAVHSDAYAIAGSADFQGWIARQPTYVQQVMSTGSSDDIIQVMTSYKQTMQNAGKQNASQQNAGFKQTAVGNNSSTVVNTDKTQQTFTRAQIGAMSEAEFLANEDAINNAMVAGLIR